MFSLLLIKNCQSLLWRNCRSRYAAALILAATGGLLMLSVFLSAERPPQDRVVSNAGTSITADTANSASGTTSPSLPLPVPYIACGLLIVGLLLPLLVVGPLSRQGRTPSQLSYLETPFLLAHDRDLFDQYRQFSRSLLQIGRQADPIYRSAALSQVSQMNEQIDRIGGGTLVYEGTETWRMVYETLLRSPGTHRYRSVAWLQNVGYWLNEPGQQSMQLNFELQAGKRVQIERIAILAEPLWPCSESLPIESVRQWIHEQHSHGIDVRLVKQSDITREPELVVDMGIYGSRAVGFQETDQQCQTVRFTLTFDFDRLLAAEKIWDRLRIYSVSYANLLDRPLLDAYDPEPVDLFPDD